MDTKVFGVLGLILGVIVMMWSLYSLGKTTAYNEVAQKVSTSNNRIEELQIGRTTPDDVQEMPQYDMGCGSSYKVIVLIAPDPEQGHRYIRFERMEHSGKDYGVIVFDCTGTKHTVPWTSILRIEEREE